MSSHVYVGGLDHHVKKKDIEKCFHKFGHICKITMKKYYCFIEFKDTKDANAACAKMNGQEILGMRITTKIVRGSSLGQR